MARWVLAEKYSIVARRNGLQDLLRQDGCWLGNGTKEGGGLTFWVSGRDCHGGPMTTDHCIQGLRKALAGLAVSGHDEMRVGCNGSVGLY